MSNVICSVAACEGGAKTRGWCNKHYMRWYTHGSVDVVLPKGQHHKAKYTADGLKICKLCAEAKLESEYHKDSGGTNGLRAICKTCVLERERQRLVRDGDQVRARQRARRIANPEHYRSVDQARYERDREKRVAAATVAVHIRRARVKNLPSDAGITVRALLKRDGNLCCYCGVEMEIGSRKRGDGSRLQATVEHLLPISRGGSHTWGNVKLACRACNFSKHDKTVEEWKPLESAEVTAWSALANLAGLPMTQSELPLSTVPTDAVSELSAAR